MLGFKEVLVLWVGVVAVVVNGCLPTTSNEPTPNTLPCACSPVEFITDGLAAILINTATKDSCTLSYQCSYALNQALTGVTGGQYFLNDELTDVTATTSPVISLTCDTTTRTYSSNGVTGITQTGCTTRDIIPAGSGGGGAPRQCTGACNPYQLLMVSLLTTITDNISDDCNTITLSCTHNTAGELIAYQFADRSQAEIGTTTFPGTTSSTVTIECDESLGQYTFNGGSTPIGGFICGDQTLGMIP